MNDKTTALIEKLAEKFGTAGEQLHEWVDGNSIHNTERDECCPDFSCCQKHYSASEEERRLFRDRPELRDQMLMGFLDAVLAGGGKSVHVAGSIEGSA
jgi:hypothetical protein